MAILKKYSAFSLLSVARYNPDFKPIVLAAIAIYVFLELTLLVIRLKNHEEEPQHSFVLAVALLMSLLVIIRLTNAKEYSQVRLVLASYKKSSSDLEKSNAG